ncbi:hypothetical protein CHUAL_011205 [Chamberlinius hualienensis]
MATPLRGRLRTSFNFDSDSDVSINDDDAEKLQRRQEKVLELARSSPKRLSLLPSRSNVHGMSSSLLVEHYTNCMKLSTENKVTIKNAFGLHLIDYMAEMIRKKDSQFDNFQVASCTLDASAKIYSYRVDCVHADTMKIVSGLSRNEDGKTKRKNKDAEMIDDGENIDEPAKKKRVKRGRTIEVNFKNINTTKLDKQCEIDPVIQNISKAFLRDGSSVAVFLTSLNHYNSEYVLTLDSRKEFEYKAVPGHFGSVPIPMTDLTPFFENVVKDGMRISTAFDGLQLGKLDSSEQSNYDAELKSKYDITVNDNDFVESHNAMEEYMDTNQHDEDDNGPNNIGERSNPSKLSVFDEINSNGNFIKALSLEQNEYSYFKPQFLTAWAGPNHWHVRPRSKITSSNGTTKVARAKKPTFEFDFRSQDDVLSFFKKSKTSLCLAKTTIQKWDKDHVDLPENTYYEDKSFFKLFLNSLITLLPQRSVTVQKDETKDCDYNYDNANDIDNYCPSADLPDNQDDTDEDAQLETEDEQNIIDHFTGENLVDKPFQVPKFEIPYPRAAKKVNVKHVKSCIWDWLSENTKKKNIADLNTKSFREMYDILPNLVTSQTAKNLSPAIAFTCLLHLANEKILKIESNENHNDLSIEIEDDKVLIED